METIAISDSPTVKSVDPSFVDSAVLAMTEVSVPALMFPSFSSKLRSGAITLNRNAVTSNMTTKQIGNVRKLITSRAKLVRKVEQTPCLSVSQVSRSVGS